jgi:Bacterial TniB protein
MVNATAPASRRTKGDDAPAAVPDEGDDQYRQLTTLEGWRRFVDHVPAVPDLLDRQACQHLDPHRRLDYDEARLAHHSQLLVVATPTVRKVITEGRRLSYLNRYAVSGRCGLILSGPARTGKTTAITQMAKTLEVIHRQRHPRSPGDIPVAYITTPPAATSRMMAVELARFLGLPVIRRANITDIIEAVCGVCLDAHTGLICVDEIHNISLTTRYGAEASDTLKYFAERIPATFVYAGINLARANLFTGTRGEQIASRFATISTKSFAYGTPAQRETWRALVATLEQALRLHQHRPGTLARHGEYLYQRTHGMIGSLSHLIRGAAIDAILDGTEKITKAHLEAILLDHAAETAQTAAPKKRAPRRAGVA